MTDLSRDERFDRLDAAIAQGRILRNCWLRSDAQGRSLVGLLAALSPEAGQSADAEACPASVIPAWLAHLTPSINDYVSNAAWPSIIRRYATVVRRAAVLMEEDWHRLDYAARAVALRVALPHAGLSTTVVEGTIALCDRAASGGVVSGPEWDRASEAAWAASEAAWRRAWAAEQAALAAQRAAQRAAERATEQAALAAGRAAAVALPGTPSRTSRRCAPCSSGAWDTIANGILDAIDAACAAREASS